MWSCNSGVRVCVTVCAADEDAVVSRDFASSNLLSAFLFSSSLASAVGSSARTHTWRYVVGVTAWCHSF